MYTCKNSSPMLPVLVILLASVLVGALLPLMSIILTEESMDIQNSLSDGNTAAEWDMIHIIPIVTIVVAMLATLLVICYMFK